MSITMAPSLTPHFLTEAQVISPAAAVKSPTNVEPTVSGHREYKWSIKWRNVMILIYFHSCALYALYLTAFNGVQLKTIVWMSILAFFTGEGITAGAHRLWAHRTYSARWPLRVLLMIANSMAFQTPVYDWVKDHRVHHKFTDTDADPHNSSRGFFYSHMGWLLIKKLPDVIRQGKTLDLSDLEKDWVIMFQKKYYLTLVSVCCFLIPTLVPWYFWDEKLTNAWYVCALFRHTLALHCTWLVNSAAHLWGMKPYDKHIRPAENVAVAFAAFGEGWHNYHHTFPWDYKAAELGNYRLNPTTAVIDFFAWLGWAYNLKTATPSMVSKRMGRTGDGSKYDGLGSMGYSHEN